MDFCRGSLALANLKETIDLFVSDSDHSEIYEEKEYTIVDPKLSTHGVILSDNAHCTDKLLQFSLRKSRRFIYFQEKPLNHWYPGAGLGISLEKEIQNEF